MSFISYVKTTTNKRYSYPRVTVIRIDVHPTGENSTNTPHASHTQSTYGPRPYVSHAVNALQPFMKSSTCQRLPLPCFLTHTGPPRSPILACWRCSRPPAKGHCRPAVSMCIGLPTPFSPLPYHHAAFTMADHRTGDPFLLIGTPSSPEPCTTPPSPLLLPV
jgi:hypothetical protein